MTGKPRGRPFVKGVAPNPAGRPVGARHKTTVLAEKLMQDDAETIVNAVLTAARKGDMTAARIVIDRLVPVRKGAPVTFTLPAIKTAADVVNAIGTVAEGMASGELTPDEATAVAAVLEIKRRAIETVDIEERLRAVEEAQANRK